MWLVAHILTSSKPASSARRLRCIGVLLLREADTFQNWTLFFSLRGLFP
jgi:hypothetical protein